MAKSNFKIAYVKRGSESLWRDYWKSGGPTEEAQAASENGSLGLSEFVTASNLREAIAAVQLKHPDCTVMLEGSGRIG